MHPFAGHGASQALFGTISSSTIRDKLTNLANGLYNRNRADLGELNDKMTNHELLSGLLYQGEEIIPIPPMMLSEVHFGDQETLQMCAKLR